MMSLPAAQYDPSGRKLSSSTITQLPSPQPSRASSREKAFREGCERDRADVKEALERERRYTTSWLRLSTNRIWAREPGPPVETLDGEALLQQFKGHRMKMWPNGRDVRKLNMFNQTRDYFCFMWRHTQPYETVTLLVILSMSRPLQALAYSYLIAAIEEDYQNVSVWLYCTPLFAAALNSFVRWWYEITVPLAGQRNQLRTILITQRVRLPESSRLARKWSSPGRFASLLSEVEKLVNGVWGSCLTLIEDFMAVSWIVGMCIGVLSGEAQDANVHSNMVSFGVYVIIFLILGVTVTVLPYLWLVLYVQKLKYSETLADEGQAVYLSAAVHAVTSCFGGLPDDESTAPRSEEVKDPAQPPSYAGKRTKETDELYASSMVTTANQADAVFMLAAFRDFFFGLAMTTNYGLLAQLWGPFIAYFLLTYGSIGESTTSTVIVLLSLRDFATISGDMLSLLIDMRKGCWVLEDVSEFVNLKLGSINYDEPTLSQP